MRLHTAGSARGFRRPIVARITTEPIPVGDRTDAALVLSSINQRAEDVRGYAAVIVKQEVSGRSFPAPLVHSVRDIDHLASGHVVVLEAANGFIRTLYRPESRHNTLFATERCNSNCLMCSQPPIDRDDIAALTERNLKLIDLMSPAPEYLCITGGEPTLLEERLLTIVAKLRDTMPGTYVHILTNGRRFAWGDFASRFAAAPWERPSMTAIFLCRGPRVRVRLIFCAK